MSSAAIDWLMTLGRMSEVGLLCVSVAAATTSRKHLPLIAWLVATLSYSLLSRYAIGPILTHLPRPYHGAARLLMHAGQALFLAVAAGSTALAWRAYRVPAKWLPLPFFVAFCALAVLVDGYGHSPGPGLYRVGRAVFPSNSIFTPTALVLTVMAWTAIVPRLAHVLLEPFDEHDTALSVTTVALLVPGTLHVALPFAWSAVNATRIHAALVAVACSLSIGVYAALLTKAGRAGWSDMFEKRLLTARRARALRRIAERLEDTERRLLAPRDSDPAAWRFIAALMDHAGRHDRRERLVLTPAQRIVDLERAAAVTGALRDLDALRVLENARTVLASAKLPREAPIRIEELLRMRRALNEDVMWAPVTLMLLSAMQRTSVGCADSVFAELEELHRSAHRRGCESRLAADEIENGSSLAG